MITVVGLGPAGPELITTETRALLDGSAPVWLRTSRHPAAAAVAAAESFDHLYETLESFAAVYDAIVAALVTAATESGRVVYAVPGSPSVAERTVELLGDRSDIDVDVRPALSFADLAWRALGVDPMAHAVTLVDAHRFSVDAAGLRGPLLVTQVHSRSVLTDLRLALADAGAVTVTVLQGLGTPHERVDEVALDELDTIVPDHLTSLWLPRLPEPIDRAMGRFAELVHRLRAECPWDRAQTHGSLRKHLLEETHEVLEAIDAVERDPDSGYVELEEELGDLLFQVFFHARLAAEAGRFTVSDVADGIHDKLHARHPHVFGDADADEVMARWEQSKTSEKARESLMDGIPPTLPALLGALKVQKRAATTGFSGPDLPWALADVEQELAEVIADPGEHEVGDLLYAAVQVARMLDVDPEAALRAATNRFASRFRVVERLARTQGVDLARASLAELEAIWADAKQVERASEPASG